MIRSLESNDVLALKKLIDDVELFPSEMLDEMLCSHLGGDECEEVWLTFVQDGTPIAIGYCAPERMTDGTWNQYLIAVSPQWQGKGIGTEMIRSMEQRLADAGHRVLLVETSGQPEFERTRQFYRNLGFEQEACIRDFYAAGDDKIVFWKSIAKS